MGNSNNQTGLHIAAINGHIEVSQVLLRAGAHVNAQNADMTTPLHCAARGAFHDLAELLIEAGAETHIADLRGDYPYKVASDERMRIICGAPSLKIHDAVMDLASVYDAKSEEACAMLLETTLSEGIPLTEQDAEGNTPLHFAVKSALGDWFDEEEEMAPPNPSKSLNVILSSTCAVGLAEAQSLRNNYGRLPVHMAAADYNVPICEALLEAGAPIDVRSLRGGEYHSGDWGKKAGDGTIQGLARTDKTPLAFAVQYLLDRYEEDEEAPIDASLVRLLLKHGADPNILDLEDQSPLHLAIMGSMYEVVELLADAKSDLSLSCKTFGKGNTALHQATITRDVRMIKLLAERGAPVDAHGAGGWTCLCLAARSGATDVAKALIEAGANVNAPSGTGKTPLEIATINNKPALVELFKA